MCGLNLAAIGLIVLCISSRSTAVQQNDDSGLSLGAEFREESLSAVSALEAVRRERARLRRVRESHGTHRVDEGIRAVRDRSRML